MASRFRLRRWRSVPRFLVDSLRVFRQVCATDGALGVSLVARPLRREFLTLSPWRDGAALRAPVGAEPHAGAMRRNRPAMAESVLTTWEAPTSDLPVPWAEAQRRISAAAATR